MFDRTLELIAELGGEVVEVGLPHAPHGISAYYVIAPAEASSNLARYDGVRYGLRAGNGTLLDLYERTRAEGFGDEVKRRIMLGTFALSAGYYEAYYGRAQRVRTKIADDFRDRVRAAATSSSRRPRRPSRSSSASAPAIRSRCTCPTTARCRCRWRASPRSRSPPGWPSPPTAVARPRACRSGFQIAGPAFSENRMLDAALRARAGDRLRHHGGVPVSPATDWEPVIGLEIHVQLSTRTKMFCACALSFGEPPNTRTCPVCLGHPGTLPTLNAEAVHYGLMIALALGCEVAPRSIFHRKNYFYPDLPKGYQISQYDIPLASSGTLDGAGRARRCASTARTSRRTPRS